MNKFVILGGAALVVVTGVAIAQPQSDTRPDRNADFTRQQVIERVDQRFARLDLDRDGRFTREESQQRREQRREERAGRMFDRLDLNHDGNIGRAEFDQARARLREERVERREQGAERGEHRGMRGMRGMHGPRRGFRGMRGERWERLFGEQGFITLEQMRERALARFDRLDADRNGTVTMPERQQAREQLRERRRERRGEPN